MSTVEPLNASPDAEHVDVPYAPQGDDEPKSLLARFVEEITHLRWRALFFANFITFGGYYVYDFPSSIGTSHTASFEARFIAHGKTYTQEQNQALYSVYSWPNTVLAFCGGILVDKVLGIRTASMLFVTIITIGSIVVYIGAQTVSYPVLLAGRFIFGLGNECLSVSQSAYVARWFSSSKFIALAFGITISFSRVGSSFNFLISPRIAEKYGVEYAAMAGIAACGISVLATSVIGLIDVYGTRTGAVPPLAKDSSGKFHPRDILKLPLPFWLLALIVVAVYCSIFPFIGIAKNYVQVTYGVSNTLASTYVSVYQFVCAGASPVLGAVVDKVGRFTFILVAANVGFAGIHALMAAVAATPAAFAMSFMGVAYSVLVAALWPLIPFCVDASLVGIAYGICYSMQNTGLAIFPLIVGAILDPFTPADKQICTPVNGSDSGAAAMLLEMADISASSASLTAAPAASNFTAAPVHEHCFTPATAPLPTREGYVYTEMLFCGSALAGVVIAVLLTVYDFRRQKGILSASAAVRRREAMEKDRREREAAEHAQAEAAQLLAEAA